MIRGAQLVLANKQSIDRQIKNLYPLQIIAKELQPSLTDTSSDKAELKRDQPKRAAAVLVNKRINIDQL